MSSAAKTRRRLPDLSGGGFSGFMSDRADQFMKFLETNSEDAFTRPWHRLEKGMRLNRIRRFTEEEAERFKLRDEEKANLFSMLAKALEKKQLNSKSIVTYDTEQQKITEIKGLVFHKQADGQIVYQIVERKSTGTQKKRASEPPKPPVQNTDQE